jgi:hypothetical protein
VDEKLVSSLFVLEIRGASHWLAVGPQERLAFVGYIAQEVSYAQIGTVPDPEVIRRPIVCTVTSVPEQRPSH